MGPQLDFFSPEVIVEEDLHGPGIDVRGPALPGALPFPIVGHTPRFAWSVTIGVGDHIDIFAERLCNPDGSPATRASDHYLYHGRCVPFLIRDRAEMTTPNALDSSPPERFVLRTIRSVHGPIQSFGLVRGRAVAFSRADATYFHLADVGVYYDRLLTSGVTSPHQFIADVAPTPFSLNWFYIDSHHIAWTLSGRYPLRAHGTNPDLPAWGTGRWDWPGFQPSAYVERALPGGRMPHAVDPPQGYIANWNNKPAPGWRAASDDFYYSSAHRVQMLTARLAPVLRHQHRIDPTQLASMVEDIATADMRGERVLPWALRVIGRAPRGRAAQLVGILARWVQTGAHRRDLRQVGHYDDSAAVALMDAWWPRMIAGIFEPVLGSTAFKQALAILAPDDQPNVDAEAWYNGWYGQVEQDLRDVVVSRSGRRGRGPLGSFSRVYCGGRRVRGGSRRGCRAVLLSTLMAAADHVAGAQGSSDPSSWHVPTTCPVPASGPAPCDEIVFSPLGAVGTTPIPWQNRPTFQQLVEIG
jgi:acyl-homoserine lactone acylase PvdQ